MISRFQNITQELIDAIDGVLDGDGVIILGSCQDTATTTLEDYQAEVDMLAETLGYEVWACYGDLYVDQTTGAMTCDGTWVIGIPD